MFIIITVEVPCVEIQIIRKICSIVKYGTRVSVQLTRNPFLSAVSFCFFVVGEIS